MKLGAISIGILVSGVALVGCGGGSKPTTPQCTLPSDCAKLSTPGLTCALGYCVKPCNISSDCPNNERCVIVSSASASASGGSAGGASGGSAGGASGSAGGASGSDGGTIDSAAGISGSAGGASGNAGGASGGGGSAAGAILGTACQALEIASCTYNSMCKTPLICSGDHQCRDQCETNVDCPMGQVCTSTSHLCADPTIDKDYNSTINDFVVSDAGVGIAQSGSGGSGNAHGGTSGSGATSGAGATSGGGATGGAGGHGGSGAGGGAGTIVNSCPSPQTSFGNIAQGDSNTAFTSGVGVRDGNQLFVFSGYVTPPLDAGVDAGAGGNYIYVQAFDSDTGNSKGPAAPLFKTADGPNFGVFDVSVAPTGEIAVLHSRGISGNGYSAASGYGFSAGINLYVSFLNLTQITDGGVGGAGGGVAGLEVVHTVLLESADEEYPHVIWSVANQAFVISWKYYTTDWFTRVRKFQPSGQSAGGDTNVVPTPTGDNNNYGSDEAQVGTSGNLFGAAYRNPANGTPSLTILDADGLQVGNLLPLSSLGIAHWVSTGGTTNGFVTLFNINGATVDGVFVPTSGAGSVITDGGVTVDAGGDAGVAKLFTDFSITSSATTAKMVSDDTGGLGGVGAVLLESNGASFIYVTANGSKRLASGTIISSAHGVEVGLSNYHGSFALSLYDSAMQATQVVASGCNP